MSEKVSRRSFLKKLTMGTLGLVGLSYGGYYYAHEIEPRWLTTSKTLVESKRIPQPFNNFKILQFTDTHIGFHYRIKDFEKLVEEINQQSADLIVFTGDLTDNPSEMTSQDFHQITKLLSEIEAPYGKYWIFGNHDHGGYGTRMIQNVMHKSGFKLLRNDTTQIKKDNSHINLSGLDDILLGTPNISNLISEKERDQYNILLCHEPDFAQRSMDFPFDLQLSGHSHGGQIQLPLIGYIVTPRLGTRYVEGHYKMGERPLNLYVSRGVGTTRLPFRLFCRPEINIFTLQSNSRS